MPVARLRSAVLLGALVLALLPGVASAAPAVTSTNDSGPGSLRAAIEGAAPPRQAQGEDQGRLSPDRQCHGHRHSQNKADQEAPV